MQNASYPACVEKDPFGSVVNAEALCSTAPHDWRNAHGVLRTTPLLYWDGHGPVILHSYWERLIQRYYIAEGRRAIIPGMDGMPPLASVIPAPT
jgi:hypothetical protein